MTGKPVIAPRESEKVLFPGRCQSSDDDAAADRQSGIWHDVRLLQVHVRAGGIAAAWDSAAPGMVARSVGRTVQDRSAWTLPRRDPPGTTYWIRLAPPGSDPAHMFGCNPGDIAGWWAFHGGELHIRTEVHVSQPL